LSREQRFNELYRDTFTAVYTYCLRRVDDSDEVDDVVAEVYTAIWRRFGDALSADTPVAWVLGVAYGVVGNAERGASRRSRLGTRLTRVERLEATDPADLVATADELDQATRALDSLAPPDRELLRLALWDDLTHDEIAAVLNLELASVRSKLHRARNRFRKKISAEKRDKSAEPDTNK